MNKIFMLIIFSFALNIQAMEKDIEQKPQEKSTYTITETCHKEIAKINDDSAQLYYYLKGSFNAAAVYAQEKDKPSNLLNFLHGKIDLDNQLMLAHTSATSYLKQIFAPYYKEFDLAFDAQFAKIKNLKLTWQWFADDYFKKKALDIFNAYKMELVKSNAENLEMAKKGIFFHNDTVIINPDLAQDGAYPEAKSNCPVQ